MSQARTAAQPHLVRIFSQACSSYGWQARVPYATRRYVSRFFSDKVHGGSRKAKAAAVEAQAMLAARDRKSVV